MEKKELSKEQIVRRIENAVVFVPKDKEYKGVYFFDKPLRLEVTGDAAIVGTAFHQHVFQRVTASGLSRPYAYVSQFIDIALAEESCKTKDGYSYSKLFAALKEKEDRTEYNICWLTDLWLFNIFQPLYSIGESVAESFLIYEDFLHNVARNKAIPQEKNEDITNRMFVDKVIASLTDYFKGLEEFVIYPKEAEEDAVEKEAEALAQLKFGEEVKHGLE